MSGLLKLSKMTRTRLWTDLLPQYCLNSLTVPQRVQFCSFALSCGKIYHPQMQAVSEKQVVQGKAAKGVLGVRTSGFDAAMHRLYAAETVFGLFAST